MAFEKGYLMEKQRQAEIGFMFFKRNTGIEEVLRFCEFEEGGEPRMAARAGIKIEELREFLAPFKEARKNWERDRKERERKANKDKTIFITDSTNHSCLNNMTMCTQPFSAWMRRNILDSGKRIVLVINKPEISKLFEETEKEITGIASKRSSCPEEFERGDNLLVLSPSTLDELCYRYYLHF